MASLAPTITSAMGKPAVPQSLSAAERGNPPPRRKSCAGCISAKRRCSLEQPSCARCTQRKLSCKYPSGAPTPASARSRAPNRQPSRAAPSAEGALSPIQMDLPLSFSLGLVEENPTPTMGDASASMFSSYSSFLGQADPSSLLLPTVDIGRSSSSSSSNVSLLDDPMLDISHASLATTTPSSTSTTEMPEPQDNDAFWNDVLNSMKGPPAKDIFVPAFASNKTMAPQAVTANPWNPSNPNSSPLIPDCHDMQLAICSGAMVPWPETVAAIFASRLQYILEVTATAPTRMVLENSTAWSHPALWTSPAGMPRAMQDAQACCALHMARNDANKDVITRNLDSRAVDLLATPSPFTIASSTSTPLGSDSTTSLVTYKPPLLDQIAHTQALLLHLLMRMDNPEPIGAQISDALEVSHNALLDAMLTDTSTALAPTVATTPTLPLYPLAPTRDAWRAWIVAESARRTALVAFVVRQIYQLKRGQQMPCGDDTFRMYQFSIPASLWAAKDPVDFALAWRAAAGDEAEGKRDKRRLVNIMELQGAMEGGDPDDFDLIGKMSLTAVFGIDEVKGWYASKGAVF